MWKGYVICLSGRRRIVVFSLQALEQCCSKRLGLCLAAEAPSQSQERIFGGEDNSHGYAAHVGGCCPDFLE